MASEYPRTSVVMLLFSFLSLLFINVEAVDDVYISDKFNGRFTFGQKALVIQHINHTFQCLAEGTRTALMRWEVVDGNTGRFRSHSDGYPKSDSGNMLGQISFYPELNMTSLVLRCRVEDGRNIDHEVVLNVQVPPENVTMSDANKPDRYQPEAVVTLTQHMSHSAQCLVKATTPACNVIWTIDDKVKYASSSDTLNKDDNRLRDTTSTTTFIPQRSHHKTYLECSSSISVPNIGDFPSPPVSMRVQLHVNGPPDTPYITGSSSQVEDVAFGMQCYALKAFPAASLRWYLDNIDITNYAQQTNYSDGNGRDNAVSILTYTLSRVHNQQELRCDAHHQTLSSSLQSKNYTMNVEFCQTSITLSYTDRQSCPTSIVAGDTVSLTCRSSSSNPNSTIVWYANDKEQTSQFSPTYQRSDNNGWATELKFKSHSFTPADVGIQIKCCVVPENACPSYLCSDLCKPDVYYAPVFQEIEIPHETKLEGESALLSCDVIARPKPHGFVKWKKDNATIEGSFDEDEGRLLYLIPEITRHDAGTYMCLADNGIGSSSSQPKNLTVIYKPSLLEQHNPKTVSKGNRVELTATLRSNPISVVKWTSPTGPIPPNGDERYDVETTIPDGYEDDVRGTTALVKLIIKSVSRSNDTGQFICKVSNSAGDLPVTFKMEVVTESDFSVIIISSCSALAVIIIVAVVGILVFYKRRNGSSCDIHFPQPRSNDNDYENDSFDEDADNEELYVNTTLKPEKPKPLPALPGTFRNIAFECADDAKHDTIQKPLPMPKPPKHRKRSKSPMSYEDKIDCQGSGDDGLKYYQDGYIYPNKPVGGNVEHGFYHVNSENAGQNDGMRISAVYDPVAPGVPDFVPMRPPPKIPLKPTLISLKPPPSNLTIRKDLATQSGESFQSQLAKALERRKTNDTNV